MKLTKEEFQEFKEEILELTDLLNSEWSDLKEILLKEIDLKNSYLCSYFEDEEGGEYGVVLTQKQDIFEFSLLDGELKVDRIEDMEEIEEEYPQILVALKMIKDIQ